MFDLNQAMADWRQQLVAAGIKTPATLHELESHLREEIERQVHSGCTQEQAFEMAVRRLGTAAALRHEFRRVALQRAWGKLMGGCSVVLVGFILWMSGFTFSQMALSPSEQIVAFAAVAFSLVVAAGWRYAVPLLPVILNKRTRRAVELACFVAGFLCSNLFCLLVLPHFEQAGSGQIPAMGFWAAFPIAVFLSLACGIHEAARRPTIGAARGEFC